MLTGRNLETDRLKAVNRFLNLKISREKELEDIVSLAASICQSPVALITLIDEDVQYYRFKTGNDINENPRKFNFSNYLTDSPEALVIDAPALDGPFTGQTLTDREKAMHFNAGAPLTTHNGENIGSICVLDHSPKQLDQHQKDMLTILSRQVINILEFELSLSLLKEQYAESENAANKLRSFFESSLSSHALLNKNYEVLSYNKYLYNFIEQMYGVKLHTGLKATDYMNRQYMRDFIRNFTVALSGKPVVSEREIQHPVAGNHWFRFAYDPAFDGEGNIIGISWSAIDINESKLHERRILEQNEALRRIAYVQSHEFRRPVASILGLMNVMRMEGYGEHEECLKMLDEAAHELDDAIRKIVMSAEPVTAEHNGTDFLKTAYSSN